MIPIQDLKEFALHIQNLIELEKVFLVSREEQLQKFIKEIESDKAFGVLVIPASKGEGGNPDNYSESNTLLIYLLQKVNDKNTDHDSYLNILAALQDKLELVKTDFINAIDNCDHAQFILLKKLDVKSTHTDPEFNYMGCHGWSFSFRVQI